MDDEEAPLPSPDPVIIHNQAPLTPDGSPLMGPPPYQPPAGEAADHSSPPEDGTELEDADLVSTDDSYVTTRSAVITDQSPCKVPRTVSAPVAQETSPVSSLAQSESLSAAERAEDRYLAQLLEQASALTTSRNQNQDLSEASEETQATDTS